MQNAFEWNEGDLAVASASVHWRRTGGGPAILLQAGFPLSGEAWDGVVTKLRSHFTCWTLDLIGLGKSDST